MVADARVVFAPPPPGGRWRGMSLSLNFQVWHQMAYFVLMRYGHSTSSPSLTLSINTILAHAVVNIRPLPRPIQRRSCGTASTVMKLYHYVFAILFYLWNAVEVNVRRGRPICQYLSRFVGPIRRCVALMLSARQKFCRKTCRTDESAR